MGGGRLRPHWIFSWGYRSCLGSSAGLLSLCPLSPLCNLHPVVSTCNLPDASPSQFSLLPKLTPRVNLGPLSLYIIGH